MLLFQKGILYENHEVLTHRSFKIRAKKNSKNTKEFCQITSLIAAVGDSVDSQNGHPQSVIWSIFASRIWTSGLESESPPEFKN